MDIFAKSKGWDISGAYILVTSREAADIKYVIDTLALLLWLAPTIVDYGVTIFLKREFRTYRTLNR